MCRPITLFVLSTILFTLSLFIQAQETLTATSHADEAVVVEKLESVVSFENDGTGFVDLTTAIRMQSDAGPQNYGLLSFPYAKENDELEIVYLRVRKPDGTVVVTPPDYVQDMPAGVSRTAPMYSDLREKQVAVRGLATGDLLEYQVRRRVTRPQVPGEFWYIDNFNQSTITKQERLEIRIPAGRNVILKSPSVKPEIAERDGKKVYVWNTRNLTVDRKTKKRQRNEKEPEPKEPSVQISTFRDWESIGRWFEGLQRDRIAVTPAISAKAAELTKNATTPEDKLRNIYEYVSTRFRYVSISFGIGRFQPHSAGEVLENEYGDCKDKHTLMAALLKAVGIDAMPALVNSDRKLDADVPSIGQFDHVITYVKLGEKEYWLDSTPEVSPFGFVLSSIRGKESLLVVPDKPRLTKVPDEPPFPMEIKFNIDAKLAGDGTLTAKVDRVVRGEAEVLFRAAFRKTPRSQWKDVVQALSYAAGYAGEVSNIEADAPEDTHRPFRWKYDYTRKNFGDWENRRISTAMPPWFGIELSEADTQAPEQPILLGDIGEVTFRSTLQLPEGYSIQQPPDVNLSEEYADYKATYSLKGNILTGERILKVKRREVPVAAWSGFRNFAKKLEDDEDRWIYLQTGAESVSLGTTPEQDALYEQARQAFERRDMRELETRLEDLRQLNDRYPGLWTALAQVRLIRRDEAGGIAALKKEIEHHPKDVRGYQMLAFTHNQTGHPEKAIETWEELLVHDPRNMQAHMELGTLLERAGKTQEALRHLEPALESAPENPRLLAQIGLVYLKVGKIEEGRKALDKAVEKDTSTFISNNIAYALAENGLELERAKELALNAVERTELATADTSLDKLTPGQLQRMASIASYWDTLGWVYFQLREDSLAEHYLRAAWWLGQSGVTADHLGQLYEREGKKVEARHMYRLALAGPRVTNREALEAKVKRLGGVPRRKGVPARIQAFDRDMDAASELSKLRTVKLPWFAKRGSAEYYILLNQAGKVEDARMISGDNSLRGAGEHLKRATYGAYFPPGSKVKLVRRSMVVCSELASVGCSAVLLIPDTVNSVD